MSNQPKPPVPAPARPPVPPGSAPGEHEPFEDDLKVPKGVSRTQFLVVVGLMILLLIIFIVPDSLTSLSTRGGDQNPVTTRFRLPDGRTVEWKAADVIRGARALESALGMDSVLAFGLGITDLRSPDAGELERVMILDELAKASGVEVTDADLAGHLREMLSFSRSSDENFKAAIRAQGLDQKEIEESIRALMRVTRFTQMIGFAGAVPSPAAIEKKWHEDNVEYAYDYVAVELASLKEEALKGLPDDAGLKAWFEKLPEGERNEFKSEEKRTAEVAVFRDMETTNAEALLAAFPEKTPEGVEPTAADELAQQYYNRVFVRRFAKTPVEGSTEPPGFLSFDEVKPQCLAEAPVFFALQRWLEDLTARKTNGETIDFAAEAAKYGLEHQHYLQALPRSGFEGADGANDKDVATTIFTTAPDGSFSTSPTAARTGLYLVRVNTRVEPEPLPFEEIRARVVDKWVEPESEKLALKKLAALREGLEKFTPPPEEEEDAFAAPDTGKHFRASAEAFTAAVQASGWSVARRDFLNKAGPATDDPQHENEHHKTLVSQAYSFGLYDLEPDEVAAPGVDGAKKYAYLVRRAASREVPITKMSPAQYESYKRSARTKASTDTVKSLDFAFLREHFGLWRLVDERKDEAAAQTSAAGN